MLLSETIISSNIKGILIRTKPIKDNISRVVIMGGCHGTGSDSYPSIGFRFYLWNEEEK